MRKRKTWLYILYTVIVVIGAVIALVFIPKDDENPDDMPPNQEDVFENGAENGSDNNNDITPEEPEESNNITLTLNLPESINLLVGTKMKFSSGYISVEPNEKLQDLNIEIDPRYNSDPFGLTYSNNEFVANIVGSYNIHFNVESKTKTTTVYVYEEEGNSHLTANNIIMETNRQYEISDLFNLNTDKSINTQTDNKLSETEGVFSAISSGNSNVTVTVTDNFINYIYSFQFTIKEEPEYYILVNSKNIEIDMNENDAKQFSYQVVDRNNSEAYQEVKATSSDEDIVEVETVSDFIIKLRARKLGSAKILIVLKSDSNIFIEVNVIVK